jgi:hypothetical protein
MVTLEINAALLFNHYVWLTASQQTRYIIIYLDGTINNAQFLSKYPVIITPNAVILLPITGYKNAAYSMITRR